MDGVVASYIFICGFIWIAFERAEKIASKKLLEDTYLLITAQRNLSINLHEVLLRYYDAALGMTRISLGAFVPSLNATILYSTMTSCVLVGFLEYMDNFGYIENHPRAFGFFLTVVVLSNMIGDYLNFSKTRLILEISIRYKSLAIWILLVISEIACAVGIFFLVGMMFELIMFMTVKMAPEATAVAVGAEILIEKSGINWNETFYLVRLEGTPNVMAPLAVSFVSSFISLMVVASFATAAGVTDILSGIPTLQRLLNSKTSVADRPLSVLGAIAIIIFTIIYWPVYLVLRFI